MTEKFEISGELFYMKWVKVEGGEDYWIRYDKDMNEIGIDLKNQQPQLLSISMIKNSNKTVNMGCMDKESCPSLFVKDVDDWNMDDPKGKSLDDVRKIRDQIKHSVLNLLDSLECDN